MYFFYEDFIFCMFWLYYYNFKKFFENYLFKFKVCSFINIYFGLKKNLEILIYLYIRIYIFFYWEYFVIIYKINGKIKKIIKMIIKKRLVYYIREVDGFIVF